MIRYIRPPTMFGFHVSIGSRNGFGDLLNNCAAAGRAVSGTKCFKNGGGLETTAASSRSYVVWRTDAQYHFPNGKWDEYSDNPPYDYSWPPDQSATIAKGWMEGCWRIWQYNPAHFYELTNEPNPATELQIANLIAFSRECMRLADTQYGRIKLAIGGFSSGTPTEAFIEMMSPLLDEMEQQGHILALHDGAATPEYVLFKDAYEEGSALRWRKWKAIQDAYGRAMPYVYSTETYCPEFYHDYGNPRRQQDMLWYLQECAKDSYLLGTAMFELGEYNFGGGSVNLEGAIPTLQEIVMQLTPIEPELEPPPTPAPIPPVVLKVNYLNQNGIDANLSKNDCAPACEAMAANYVGGDTHTINDWFVATGAGSGLITIDQMAKAASNMGYTLNVLRDQSLATLRAMIDSGKPCILLVNPVGLQKCGTTAPHFIVVIGYSKKYPTRFYCHDPYFLAPGIGGAMIEQTTLDVAWSRCHEQYDNPDWLMMTMSKGVVPPPIIGAAWRGLQLNNGDKNTTADWQCIVDARLNAVKLTTDTDIADLDFACTLVPPKHILLRLFADLSDRVVGPVEFASWFGLWLAKFASVGGQYVEAHNEPNLYAEGLGKSWIDGTSFAAWLLVVLSELRKWQPSLKYGFPGLSPGGSIAKVRMDEAQFYAAAKYAIDECDWIGVHCYWLGDTGMVSDADGGHYRAYKNEGLPLIITEFSNPNPVTPKGDKGRQYKAYYPMLPNYVIGAYSFISSSDNPAFASETWAGTEIPDIVGSGLVVITTPAQTSGS